MNYQVMGSVVGRKFISVLCLLLLMAGAALAQMPQTQEQQQQPVREDFSDAELEKFADVYVQVVEIQQQSEAEMLKAIEDENLDINRFNEILQAQQQKQGAGEINATADEMASFNNAAQKIMGVQQETETEMKQVIEQDLGVDTYQQIIVAYQQSPDVQQKVNELLQNKEE
jgi:peroxiredoxin